MPKTDTKHYNIFRDTVIYRHRCTEAVLRAIFRLFHDARRALGAIAMLVWGAIRARAKCVPVLPGWMRLPRIEKILLKV